jgi:hypothetical protein
MANQEETLAARMRALETLYGGAVELEDLSAAQTGHVVVMALARALEAAGRRFKNRPVRQAYASEDFEGSENGRPPNAGELPAQSAIDGFRRAVNFGGGEIPEYPHPLGGKTQPRAVQGGAGFFVKSHFNPASVRPVGQMFY